MALILHIETATTVCSVALSQNGKLVAEKHSIESRAHAQLLTIFIDDLFADAGFTFKQLDAVCVSKGPGSYTGLRIGVAVAKGLCYALDKPLIAINTLFSMTVCMKEQYQQMSSVEEDTLLFCPLIDARRMEVYTAIYNAQLQEISKTNALIMDNNSFIDFKDKKLIFFGDGAQKLKAVIAPKINAEFIDEFILRANGMVAEANRRFHTQQFEDLAYFEPFYLKEFVGNKGA